MPALPTVGGSTNTWGTELNDFLLVAHNADGTPISGGWTTAFTESGASLTNWTQDSGTWTVASSAFHVNTSGGTIARLKYNTAQAAALSSVFAFEADVMMETGSVGSDAPMGLLVHWTGTGAAAPALELFKAGAGAGTKQIRGEFDATTAQLNAFTPSPTWAFDVYQNLKVIGFASTFRVLLNDAPVVSVSFNSGVTSNGATGYLTPGTNVGLVCNNAVCNFKNITLSYLAAP